MEPISERITWTDGADRRARRAWGGLTVAVAGLAAAAAFLNGSLVGSAESAGPDVSGAWFRTLANASAKAVTVPGDFRTLQSAIDAVPDGTTIFIAPGSYAERIEFHGRTLHLWGVGGAALTRLVGDGTDGPVAWVSGGSVRFDGIAFQGGQGELGRGALVDRGSAQFAQCRFAGNAGGVAARGATVTIDGCDLDGNRATLAGGAVRGEDSDIRIDRSTLRGNAAMTFGGAVAMYRGGLHMIDTQVTGNRVSSGAWGGGLYAEGAAIEVERGAFDWNESARLGSGAYLLGGTAELHDVSFRGNRCETGESVHAEHAEVRLTGGTSGDGVEAMLASGADAGANDQAPKALSMRRVVPVGHGDLDDCTASRGAAMVDCNDNGIDDACEILHGLALDADGDGRIDACQAREAEATAMAAAEPDAP